MRVALIHYWWLSNRGGESVVAALIQLYPTADLYVHVHDEEALRSSLPPAFRGRVHNTFISKIPGARKHYQKFLPLMPLALEEIDLAPYDLIISSESGPAKGVITRPDAVHICYCHSPMRYIWDMYHEYRAGTGTLIRTLFPWVAHRLRIWDRLSADRVDHFISNSEFVAARIRKYYRRESEVIHPPVNTGDFSHYEPRSDFYLCLGQLVAYKRADLAVQAFNQLGLPLIVVGEGEIFDSLARQAAPNVQLMGRQPFPVIKDLLQRCKGLIFPGMEDFGIVPVEAMAAGAPVIAFAKGGALETVIHGETGVLFREQTVGALVQAVEAVERGDFTFDSAALHRHAEKFDKAVFLHRMREAIDAAVAAQRITFNHHAD